jgi:spore coat polysaccharide biosynthesis protein SpsF (cytidylyltransferase family)
LKAAPFRHWKRLGKKRRRITKENTLSLYMENPTLFRIKNFTNPIESKGNMFMTHRWTLDYEEDFQFIETIFNHI